MKKIFVFISIILISSSSFAKEKGGGSSYINRWIDAMMNGGSGLNSIITPNFEYRNYSFEFKGRLIKGSKGDIPFFAKISRPVEINIEETRSVPGGEIVVLNAVAEEGLYREWQIRLFIESGGVSKVSEIAKEGVFEGTPAGCPETAFKRDLVVTLHGSPAGMNGEKEVKLFTFRRDTDSWDFAHPGVDPEAFKYCNPRPDSFTVESEVVMLDNEGQIDSADTVAATHKGEKDDDGKGAAFFEDNGVNYPGRLFSIGDGKEGLLLTFSIEKGGKLIAPAKLYVWSGNRWKSMWGFDAEYGKARGFGGKGGISAEWSIRSGSYEGGPAITANLVTNDDDSFKCPAGTEVTFVKKGSGFKVVKGDYPSSCLRTHSVADQALKSNIKEDKGPNYHGDKFQEIDWLFQKR